MQLVAADVDRDNVLRAAREQDLREAARRCADIEADATPRVEAEMIKRMAQLYAAARDPRVRRRGVQGSIGSNLLRSLGDDLAFGGHEPGRYGGLRLASALEQSARHQQNVCAHAINHVLTHVVNKALPALEESGNP